MLLKRRALLHCLCVFGIFYTFGYFYIAFQLTTSNKVSVVNVQWRILDAEMRLFNQLQQHGSFLNMLQETKNDIAKHRITLPVLVMACNRPDNLQRTLTQVIKYTSASYHQSHVDLPVIVSQDCGDPKTTELIRNFYQYNITHITQPDVSDLSVGLTKTEVRFLGYYNIARHYKWALSEIFGRYNYSSAIIVEDDLDLSPDFFEYFIATLPILEADPTLWCVSAWNDNGKVDHISYEPELLYRTDFFPGLGWMLLKRTWMELQPKWPAVFWDDWMRKPEQRRSRACIRPEIPRSSTFGRLGISNGQFFDVHLKFIKNFEGFVNFTQNNLSYLLQESYVKQFTNLVYSKPVVNLDKVVSMRPQPDVDAVRLEYNNLDSFRQLAGALGLMTDCKAGVPRMAYNGIVSYFHNGLRIYLSPPKTWTGYDESWT